MTKPLRNFFFSKNPTSNKSPKTRSRTPRVFVPQSFLVTLLKFRKHLNYVKNILFRFFFLVLRVTCPYLNVGIYTLWWISFFLTNLTLLTYHNFFNPLKVISPWPVSVFSRSYVHTSWVKKKTTQILVRCHSFPEITFLSKFHLEYKPYLSKSMSLF